MLSRAKHRLFLWLIGRRLLSLENMVFDCIAELRSKKTLVEPLGSQLHLALRAIVSARACLLLLKENLTQEAEAPQRVFLETCVYLLHFTWFPNSKAFEKWRADPGKPLDGRVFHLRPETEQEVARQLDLSIVQEFPVSGLFRALSNRSVHPTRRTSEGSWEEAARRRRFRRSNQVEQELYDLWETISPTNKTAVFLVQLHLFLQFVRGYLLAKPTVPDHYWMGQKTFAERAIEHWLVEFRPWIKTIFIVETHS
jgi:hypothetical protein